MYNHTQTGKLMIWILLGVSILYSTILVIVAFELIALLIIIVILIIISSFTTLNIKIDTKQIKLKFGYGIFHKNFYLKDIASAKCVKNKWYYGWGIKYWPKPPT